MAISCPIVGMVESVYVSQRLCFCNPNVQKLKALAVVHSVYHSCKNDVQCRSLLNVVYSLKVTNLPCFRRYSSGLKILLLFCIRFLIHILFVIINSGFVARSVNCEKCHELVAAHPAAAQEATICCMFAWVE